METSVRTGLSTFPVQWKVTIVPAFRKLSSMALQQHRLGQVSKHLAHISPLVKHVETPAHRFKNLAKALIRTLRHWNTVPVARLTRTLRTHSIDTPLRNKIALDLETLQVAISSHVTDAYAPTLPGRKYALSNVLTRVTPLISGALPDEACLLRVCGLSPWASADHHFDPFVRQMLCVPAAVKQLPQFHSLAIAAGLSRPHSLGDVHAKPHPVVYTVHDTTCKDAYVGSTIRHVYEQRLVEEMRASLRRTSSTALRSHTLSRVLRTRGQQKFCCLPILYPAPDEAATRDAEYAMIRHLHPSLNGINNSYTHLNAVPGTRRIGGRYRPPKATRKPHPLTHKSYTKPPPPTCLGVDIFCNLRSGLIVNSLAQTLRGALYRSTDREVTSTWMWISTRHEPLDLQDQYLFRIFGHCWVFVHSPLGVPARMLLSALPDLLRTHPFGTFTMCVTHPAPDAATSIKDRLIQLASRGAPDWLMRCSASELGIMFDMTRSLEKAATRFTARTKLKRRMAQLYGLSSFPSMCFKVRFSPYVDRFALERAMRAVVSSLHLPDSLTNMLLHSVKAIFTRGRTVKSVLCNHIRQALEFRRDRPPQCLCVEMHRLLGDTCTDTTRAHDPSSTVTQVTESASGHIAFRASSPALVHTVFAPLLQNANNSMWPTPAVARKDVQTAVDRTLPHAYRFRPPYRPGPVLLLTDSGDVRCIRPDNTTAGNIPLDCFNTLHCRFKAFCRTHPEEARRLEAGTFAEEVILLLDRYNVGVTKTTNWTTPAPVYDALGLTLREFREKFASPLNAHTSTISYCSAHERDILFGASWDAFRSARGWELPSIANPPFTNALMHQTISWAISSTYTFEDAHHWLVLPLWTTRGYDYTSALLHPHVFTVCSVPANTISFDPPHTLQHGGVVDTTDWPVLVILVSSPTHLPHIPHMEECIDRLRTFFRGTQTTIWHPTPRAPLTSFTTPPANPTWDCTLQRETHPTWDRPTSPPPEDFKFEEFTFSLPWKTESNRAMLSKCVPHREGGCAPVHGRSYTAPPPEGSMFTLPVIKALKRLTRDMYISYLDHNGGCLVVACPCLPYELMVQAFVEDLDHYERVPTAQRKIMKTWRETFKERGWDFFIRWGAQAGLAHPYLLLKEKGLLKFRPIVPYSRHPLKLLFNMAARALRHLYRSMQPPSFTLDRADQLTDLLAQVSQKGYRSVEARLGDVKNMFTELPHDVIMEALDWLLGLCAEKGVDRVYIGPTKTGEVKSGKKPRGTGWHEMFLTTLREIVKFDLENCLYVVGTEVLRQKKGVPMGSPLSPPLAILICIFYEAEALEARGPQEGMERLGVRWVDDLLMLFGSHEDMGEVAEDWGFFMTAYHEDMELEEEHHEGSFKFLDAWVSVLPGGVIQSKLFNKNRGSVLQNGGQQFYRLPHARSCVSRTVRMACITGMLHRAKTYSSGPQQVEESTHDLLREFKSIGYEDEILKHALTKMANTSGDSTWTEISGSFFGRRGGGMAAPRQ